MLSLSLASPAEFALAQRMVSEHHYLHTPVDSRTSPLAYIVRWQQFPAGSLTEVGCLIFGRPESTRCYSGSLTYGSLDDVAQGRARYSRWEIINLARIWLDPRIQRGGADYIPNAATNILAQALRRVVIDYLIARPPCFLDEPWPLRVCLSYCDTRRHTGALYRAANFSLARRNEDGIETYTRPLRHLSHAERRQVETAALRSPRSRQFRAARHQLRSQPALPFFA